MTVPDDVVVPSSLSTNSGRSVRVLGQHIGTWRCRVGLRDDKKAVGVESPWRPRLPWRCGRRAALEESRRVGHEGTVVKILVGPSSTGATIAGGQSASVRRCPHRAAGRGALVSAIESDLDYLVFRVNPGHDAACGYVHPC